MKCVYCHGDLQLQKHETVVRTYYYYYCSVCHAITPRSVTVDGAKERCGLRFVFNDEGVYFFEGQQIKCEFDKKLVEGKLVFDEVALCYVCQLEEGVRYPMWQCTFVEQVK